MIKSLSIALFAVLAVTNVVAQSPDPQQLAVAINSAQLQQFLSHKYGSLILNFHSAMGWMQVANGWGELAARAKTEDPAGFSLEEQDLEESGDSEEDPTSFLEEEMVPFHTPQKLSYDELERSTEYQLLYILKLMYVQAGNKLSAAQQSHYQTKMQLALLQGVAGNSAVAPVLYMMYYLETLKVLSSSLTIQRQDAWNTWLIYEILETNAFANSRSYVPPTFAATMDNARKVAGQTWYFEASVDLQILYLEYYVQMIIAQFGAAAAPAPAAAAPQGNAFIQEEMSAEPNKPFVPFVGAASPQYMAYYQLLLKFWGASMHLAAAQGFILAGETSDPNLASRITESKQYMASSLQQWAWLNLMTTTMEYYTLASALQAAGPIAHGAAVNNLVQTDASVDPVAESGLKSNQ